MITPLLKSVWAYRGFILGSVRREFQLRYRGTMLGVAWTVLHPLALILVYTIIFTQVMKARLPGSGGPYSYSIYLCSGIVTWGLFAEIINRCQSVFLDNANLIKKLNFPRLVLPTIVVVTAVLNFLIVFIVFLAFLLLSGNMPGISLFAMFPLLAVQVLFSVGLGVIIGVLNVFFRDAGQLTGILIQFWFWATPIVYPASILPEWIQPLMNLNPLYHLSSGYQLIFVANQWPQWNNVLLVMLFSIAIILYAFRLFRRHSGEIVDEL